MAQIRPCKAKSSWNRGRSTLSTKLQAASLQPLTVFSGDSPPLSVRVAGRRQERVVSREIESGHHAGELGSTSVSTILLRPPYSLRMKFESNSRAGSLATIPDKLSKD